ncbi:hypothetical protein T05_8230 [Trichinella murrelli]|uniref:Uncharacterized protein n=1 Tax=Trichinella murrelli TaxID=144512 RepID=A0A0V0UHL3_9BILA|nr:hypothetical protein T05_8230 [Trichinella murrelli]
MHAIGFINQSQAVFTPTPEILEKAKMLETSSAIGGKYFYTSDMHYFVQNTCRRGFCIEKRKREEFGGLKQFTHNMPTGNKE